jgi:hypothetical protein
MLVAAVVVISHYPGCLISDPIVDIKQHTKVVTTRFLMTYTLSKKLCCVVCLLDVQGVHIEQTNCPSATLSELTTVYLHLSERSTILFPQTLDLSQPEELL